MFFVRSQLTAIIYLIPNEDGAITMTATEMANDLNDLLKGEISACETYRQALDKATDSNVRKVLESNHECHTARVGKLKEEVTKAGGTPAEGSGVWGAFAKMMEGGSAVFGDKASVGTLEEGEDKGVADYKSFVEKHGAAAGCIADLQVKQDGTHAKCRDLKASLA
jgi:uncharacterized protein (TIGR02284 family)